MELSQQVGNQYTRFEEPDILFMHLTGSVTEEEGLMINDLHLKWGKNRERVVFLINFEGLVKIDARVRRVAAETLRDLPLYGMVGYNASLAARVIAKLVLTAVNLFRADSGQNPLTFHDTEADARRYIDERRRALFGDAA